MYVKISLLSILILLCFSSIILAQGVNVELIGSCPTADNATDIVINCSNAFISTYWSEGLAIIDISDLDNPTQVGSFISPGKGYGIDVMENHAILVDWDHVNATVRIIDISDFDNLNQVSLFRVDGWWPMKVVIDEDIAYVAAMGDAEENTGLYLLDVSNQTIPSFISRIAPPIYRYNGMIPHGAILEDVAKDDNYAYAACQDCGVVIIDISDPFVPLTVSTFRTRDNSPPYGLARGIKVVGDYVYVAYYDEGLVILDVSNPAEPFVAGNFLATGVRDVAICNNFAVLASVDNPSLIVLNIEDPTNPIQVGWHNTPGDGYAVAVSGNHAFLADYDGGLGIYDFTEATIPAEPPQPLTLIVPLARNYFELVSTYLSPPNPDVTEVFGEIANLRIVYQNDGKIFIPHSFNTIENFGVNNGYRVFCSDSSVWVSTGEPISWNTTYPISANTWNWIGFPTNTEIPVDVALQSIAEHIAIVMTDDGRTWIPGRLNTLGNMRPGEGYMIITDTDLNFHYDLEAARTIPSYEDVWSLPEVPGELTPTGLPYMVLVELEDEIKSKNPAIIEIFDGDQLAGKSIIQDDRPFTPVICWEGSEKHNIAGFNPGNIATVRMINASGEILASNSSMVVFGNGAYSDITLDQNSLTLPSNFTVGSAYPNPFNPSVTVPFFIPVTEKVSFAVYNVLGQQVYNSERILNAGYHKFLFDTSMTSMDLVSGVYFVQVAFNNKVETRKILLIK